MDEVDDAINPTAITAGGTSADAAAQLIRDLYTVYDKSDPEFAFFLTWLAEDYGKVGIRTRGDNPGADALREVLEDKDADHTPNFDEFDVEVDAIRFGAFFALCRLHEYRGELDQARTVLDEYEAEFGDDPLYLVLRSEVLATHGGPADFDQAIEDAVRAESKAAEWIEVQHNLAAVISRAVEQDHVYSGEQANIPSERDALLQRAATAVDRAIGIDSDYAKCYVTKARITALRGDFTEAKQLVWTAVGLVNRDRPDPERLINEFQQELSSIDLIKQRSFFENRTDEMMNDLTQEIEDTAEEYQIRVLQFLGFFAGFLAVVVAIIEIPLATQSFTEAARLVLVITGGLLSAFGGFSFVLPQTRLRRTGALILVGLILVGVGVFLPQLPVST